MKLERDGLEVYPFESRLVCIDTTRNGEQITLDVDEFRWLVLTAGPAIVCAMAAAGEEDAGRGGGPRPAEAEATEAADEPEPEALRLDVGAAAMLDRWGVLWEGDGSFTPACPACEWAGKKRATHSQAAAAVRAHQGSAAHAKKVAAEG